MKQKFLFVARLLFGLMFIHAGLNKFFNYMPVPDDLTENLTNMFIGIKAIPWMLPLIGAAELVGGSYLSFPNIGSWLRSLFFR